MSTIEVERVQRELAPKDDLSPFAGLWVALREGHVVATALDPAKLDEDPNVLPSDVITAVPDSDGIYIL